MGATKAFSAASSPSREDKTNRSIDLKPGATFGRYKIVSLLGKGGMGAVYLAADSQLDRKVAIKIPNLSNDRDGAIQNRFLREAKAAASLHHPNTCPIFDFGELDGHCFIVLAYVPENPLNKYVSPDRPVPERQAANLVRRLALAMQEAHSKGILHRDLKPANVIVNQRKEPVVMDFGLARRDQHDDTQLTSAGMFMKSTASRTKWTSASMRWWLARRASKPKRNA